MLLVYIYEDEYLNERKKMTAMTMITMMKRYQSWFLRALNCMEKNGRWVQWWEKDKDGFRTTWPRMRSHHELECRRRRFKRHVYLISIQFHLHEGRERESERGWEMGNGKWEMGDGWEKGSFPCWPAMEKKWSFGPSLFGSSLHVQKWTWWWWWWWCMVGSSSSHPRTKLSERRRHEASSSH